MHALLLVSLFFLTLTLAACAASVGPEGVSVQTVPIYECNHWHGHRSCRY